MSQLEAGKMIRVNVQGEEVLLANVQGNVYAMGAVCTHRGGPLEEGQLNGDILTCPWHGGKFRVQTGEVVGPPPKKPEPSYEVKLDGSSILVRKKS
jgi:nitrite reductase/ring-hydroxylating ferredoxin subunit